MDLRMSYGSEVAIPGWQTMEANVSSVNVSRVDITRSARHPGGSKGANDWLTAAVRTAVTN